MNPHAVVKFAIPYIKDYCKKKHYKCKTCRYYIGKVAEEFTEYTSCIFANCPCDWDIEEEKNGG